MNVTVAAQRGSVPVQRAREVMSPKEMPEGWDLGGKKFCWGVEGMWQEVVHGFPCSAKASQLERRHREMSGTTSCDQAVLEEEGKTQLQGKPGSQQGFSGTRVRVNYLGSHRTGAGPESLHFSQAPRWC
ncbi:hypothetical protein Cadr_000024580 [Camelus dromedarius]|uniref:Uncharacterized protein n=1 Tax=Camelus dromedarius TaxID=9838 RepID=A0A5N4CPC4_CAMDR|nr:hypothetical protein Cadr_000024580 [Camelus dromedarius]